MKTDNMIIKISVPLEGAMGQYLLQFPGKSRAAILSMIFAEYIANGGCYGLKGAAILPPPTSGPVKTASQKPGLEEKEELKPVVSEEAKAAPPVMANDAEEPFIPPKSTARMKILDVTVNRSPSCQPLQLSLN